MQLQDRTLMQLQLNKHRRAGVVRARRTTSTKLVHGNDLRTHLHVRQRAHPAQITRPGVIVACGSADCPRERPLKAAGGRRRRGKREKDEREVITHYDTKSEYRIRERKRGKKREAIVWRSELETTRLPRPNGKQVFRSREGPRAVCLYKTAKRRNYFICPCRSCHNIIKSRL